MRNITSVINDLKRLDLANYPQKEISKLITESGITAHMVVTLHPGKSIFRARLNDVDDHFHSKCELTYKPQRFNKTYQRASTPNRTMFYGSILPEILEKGDLDIPRAVPTYEAISWLRDKTTKGVRKATFTRWIVTHDINLVAILQHDGYYDRSSYTKQLMSDYNSYLDLHPEQKDQTKAFMSFIANEFAKDVQDKDYEYLISSTFTNNVIEKGAKIGIDGVLYPSVRLGGTGFNIAITPQAADMKIMLGLVVECIVYKLYDKTVMDNLNQAILYPNQTHFTFEKVDPESHAGEINCLKELGVSSIDELLQI